MNVDYTSVYLINLLLLAASAALFLGTIRFGDNIISLFTKNH